MAFWLGIVGSFSPIISISPKMIVSLSSPIVIAQTLNPDRVAREVYQRLPGLPPENQYISRETGAIASDNTLMSRFIRYHQYIKSRPGYRLDWQLTLADYLGINERIDSSRYPGSTTLRSNPLEGDRTVIKNLSRRQRNQLVDLLVSIYNPQPPSTPDASNQSPQPSSPNTTNTKPRLPQPGDAELLLP
ncbi:hypothetical protein IQ238_29435 [Pleurocapsales cyanobacterium LEGE 06147]|nr:hypothetical protein [Pleurocapsales cyanobacterium LEGE 06147]